LLPDDLDGLDKEQADSRWDLAERRVDKQKDTPLDVSFCLST